MARWLRGELREYARDVLLDPGSISRGWCNEGEVCRLLDEHAASIHDHGRGIWTLLVLELWQREMVAVSQPTTPPTPITVS